MQKKKLVIISLLMLGITGLVVIGMSFLDQLGCEGQLVNINLAPTAQMQILGENFIGQSFVAPYANLNRVDIQFQTYERKNTHDVTVKLSEFRHGVANLRAETPIFKYSFNAAALWDRSWYTFTFPAVSDSAGKTYMITLESPASKPGNAITVGGIDKDTYPGGSAYLGPAAISADITFRACFQMSASEKLQTLSSQITQDRPGFLGIRAVYLVVLISYVLLMIGFFWQLTKAAL